MSAFLQFSSIRPAHTLQSFVPDAIMLHIGFFALMRCCRHWFYEDYLRPLNPHLPSLSQKHFTQLIVASSPIYATLAEGQGQAQGQGGKKGGGGGKGQGQGQAKIDYDAVWMEYLSYKSMVPCCGGILLSEQGDKVSSSLWMRRDERRRNDDSGVSSLGPENLGESNLSMSCRGMGMRMRIRIRIRMRTNHYTIPYRHPISPSIAPRNCIAEGGRH